MYQEQAYIIIRILVFFDSLCIVLAGYGAYYLRSTFTSKPWAMDNKIFALSVLTVMVVNSFAASQLKLLSDKRLKSNLNMIWQMIKVVTIDFMILGSIIFAIRELSYSRLFMIYFSVLTFLFLIISRTIFQRYLDNKNGFAKRKVLIVGDQDRANVVIDAIEDQLTWGHEIVSVLPTLKNTSNNIIKNRILPSEYIDQLSRILQIVAIDEVIFAVDKDESINLKKYLTICQQMGVEVRILPALWDLSSGRIRVEQFQGVPFLALYSNNFNAAGLLYKRVLDIVGGLCGTLIFLSMYPFVAIATKLDSPGPVLFKQERVGQHGRVFKLFKFRSMYTNSVEIRKEPMTENKSQNNPWPQTENSRITRVGSFLRKTSLDEFPQFLNVLRGEMSLVGTRPPTTEEVKAYDTWHLKRLSAKPGITGLWQISGRKKITDFDKVVELDCQYLDNWQFMNDIKILLKTLVVVVIRKGAS